MKKITKSKVPASAAKSTPTPFDKLIGAPVIVRANVAGVHCGILESVDMATSSVTLTDAYRLWRVYTRDRSGSISDIAANGLKEPVAEHSIGARLSRVLIVNPQGLEVAEATKAAYKSIAAASAQ
jgi:hypothetical protein